MLILGLICCKIEKEVIILFFNVSPLNLKDTFECGQCFRWNKNPDGSYTGIAYKKVLNIKESHDGFILSDDSKLWEEYFDLSTDYNKIMSTLSCDEIMKKAISKASGIRILKQEFPEVVISFIISQNNNIPRIKSIIENLCKSFGSHLGNENFSFPEMETLSALNPSDLAFLKAGYRDNYIIDAAQKLYLNQIDMNIIKSAPIDEARNEISKIKGVGPKVADCILLFGAYRTEVFPTDVWMKKVLTKFYGIKNLTPKEISRFADERFSKLAGYAQQYLFYSMRENKL